MDEIKAVRASCAKKKKEGKRKTYPILLTATEHGGREEGWGSVYIASGKVRSWGGMRRTGKIHSLTFH